MHVYIVVLRTPGKLRTSGFTRNRREAIALAKRHPGATVEGIPVWLYRDGGGYGWDVPTFRCYADTFYIAP